MVHTHASGARLWVSGKDEAYDQYFLAENAVGAVINCTEYQWGSVKPGETVR